MKIGILSDSHDNLPALSKAVSIFNDADASLVIHAGDLISPFVSRPLKNLESEFIAVYGNNDGEREGLKAIFKESIQRAPRVHLVAGKRILILHEPDLLESLEKTQSFSAIIYGHTHEAAIRKSSTLIINPGECGGWVTGNRTVALWELETDQVEIIPLS